MKARRDLLSLVILGLASSLGIWAFVRPMVDPSASPGSTPDPGAAHAQEAPFLLLSLLGLCLIVIVANLETRRMDARTVAVLGILVGINASLRLVTGPFGASAMFLLPILCGYVLGAEIGFLLAALSMLASAILTGSLGPWLPSQMFAAGWCGMVSGWLPRFQNRAGLVIAMLAVWGLLNGFFYGVVTNLWFWPFLAGAEPAQAYTPGLALGEAALRYGVFYLTTSIWWDAGRAVGNAVLILTVGPPLLRLLERFRKRFDFELEEP